MKPTMAAMLLLIALPLALALNGQVVRQAALPRQSLEDNKLLTSLEKMSRQLPTIWKSLSSLFNSNQALSRQVFDMLDIVTDVAMLTVLGIPILGLVALAGSALSPLVGAGRKKRSTGGADDEPLFDSNIISKAGQAMANVKNLYDILAKLEETFEMYKIEEDTCQLKAICQVHRIGKNSAYGKFGDQLLDIFSSEKKLEKGEILPLSKILFMSYSDAAQHGRDQHDCDMIYANCSGRDLSCSSSVDLVYNPFVPSVHLLPRGHGRPDLVKGALTSAVVSVQSRVVTVQNGVPGTFDHLGSYVQIPSHDAHRPRPTNGTVTRLTTKPTRFVSHVQSQLPLPPRTTPALTTAKPMDATPTLTTTQAPIIRAVNLALTARQSTNQDGGQQLTQVPLYVYNPALARKLGISTFMMGSVIYGLSLIPALIAMGVSGGLSPLAGLFGGGRRRKRRSSIPLLSSTTYKYREMPLLDYRSSRRLLTLMANTMDNRRIGQPSCRKYFMCQVYRGAVDSAGRDGHKPTLADFEMAIVDTMGLAAERIGFKVETVPEVKFYLDAALVGMTRGNCTKVFPCIDQRLYPVGFEIQDGSRIDVFSRNRRSSIRNAL
ncbi:hypothetical protein HDE_09587 [Halotydeus destructor]|nr:hypothetical protein HDE_09587 [Halotydeus destructor]